MYHFLYLIQSGDDLYTNIYKIGKTTKLPEQRFKGYDKKSYPIRISLVDDCHIRENELIEIFNNKFKLAKGREYFDGNVKDMIDEFSNFCNQSEIYDKIQNDLEIMKNNEIIQVCNNRNYENIIKINNYNSKYKCNICLIEFTTKYGLDKHNTKKFKCNIRTDFQCLTCLKYFKQKRTLIEHNSKELCKKILINNVDTRNISQNNKLENGLLDIINSNMTIDKKILMIKILNNDLITENIIEILNTELSNDTKILLLIN